MLLTMILLKLHGEVSTDVITNLTIEVFRVGPYLNMDTGFDAILKTE